MFTWLFWLMLVVALVDWLGSWRGWQRLRYGTKPGTLILLIAWFTQVGGWRGPLVWFGLGLCFSLAGDILLHLPGQWFPAGLAAFLCTHILYVAGFNLSENGLSWLAILPAALVAVAFLVLVRPLLAGVQARGENQMRLPVIGYAVFLSLMWFSAMTTLFRPGWSLPAAVLCSLGGGLFFLSDSLLAINRFVRPLPVNDLSVMVTYHLGQILIASGVLLHFA